MLPTRIDLSSPGREHVTAILNQQVGENAINFLFAEWNNKAAGFVGYGSAGGTRAVEHVRLAMAEVQFPIVRAQGMLILRGSRRQLKQPQSGLCTRHQRNSTICSLEESLQTSGYSVQQYHRLTPSISRKYRELV
jgi:hypothetical protein